MTTSCSLGSGFASPVFCRFAWRRLPVSRSVWLPLPRFKVLRIGSSSTSSFSIFSYRSGFSKLRMLSLRKCFTAATRAAAVRLMPAPMCHWSSLPAHKVRGQKFVVRGQKFVVRGQKFVVRGQKFVVRGQKFVVRGQKFVVRGQKFVVRGPGRIRGSRPGRPGFVVRGSRPGREFWPGFVVRGLAGIFGVGQFES